MKRHFKKVSFKITISVIKSFIFPFIFLTCIFLLDSSYVYSFYPLFKLPRSYVNKMNKIIEILLSVTKFVCNESGIS